MVTAPATRTRARAAGGGVATAAVLITVVTAGSRLTGFVREAVIAAVFGATAEVDAYLVAHQIPNVVIALLSTALVTATIPVVSSRVRNGQIDVGHQLFRTVTWAVTAVLSIASVIMAIGAPLVVKMLAPGFEAASADQAVALTRILLIATVLVAGMNLVSGLLQVHHRFFWPAFVGVPFNLAMIAFALLLNQQLGVAALAWGFVAGSVLRVVVQLPPLRRTGFRWLGPIRLRDPGMAAIAGLLPVILIGHVVSNLNVVVDRLVASWLPDGAIAALNYAYRLESLPYGVLVVALLQVLYPALGATADQRTRFSQLTTRGISALVCLLTPVVVAMMILAVPIVQLVYARGAFTEDDVARTAIALAAFAPGLVALGARDLAMRALYGLQDRWRPAAIAGVGMGVNVVGDLALGPSFGIAGLAAATSLSFAVSAAHAIWLLARAHDGVDVGAVGAAVGRNAAAIVPSALVIHLLAGPTQAATAGPLLLGVGVAITAGVVTHMLTLRLFRAPELDALRDLAGDLVGRLIRWSHRRSS
jgi:putative peptidoglycan lipid II flippase